jgi:hypothetical protein
LWRLPQPRHDAAVDFGDMLKIEIPDHYLSARYTITA